MRRGTFFSAQNRGFAHESSPQLFALASLITALVLIFTFLTVRATRNDFNQTIGEENTNRAFFAAADAVFTALLLAHLDGAPAQPSDVAATPPSPSLWYDRSTHFNIFGERIFAKKVFGDRARMTNDASRFSRAERLRLIRQRLYLRMALQGLAILRAR